MYTILFASSVTVCTNARRAEISAATAAYAAVLIVFVSGELGGTKLEQCFEQLDNVSYGARHVLGNAYWYIIIETLPRLGRL